MVRQNATSELKKEIRKLQRRFDQRRLRAEKREQQKWDEARKWERFLAELQFRPIHPSWEGHVKEGEQRLIKHINPRENDPMEAGLMREERMRARRLAKLKWSTANEVEPANQQEAFLGGFNVFKNRQFRDITTEYDIIPTYPYTNLDYFFQDFRAVERDLIIKELKLKKAIKLNHSIEVEYKKNDTGEIDSYWYNSDWLHRAQQQYHDIHSFNEHYKDFEEDLRQWVEEAPKRGSNIIFLHIKRVVLTFAKINILKGGEYIPLPYDCSKSVLNIETKSGSYTCSLQHILAELYPNPDKKHLTRPIHYEALEYIVFNKGKKDWLDDMRTRVANDNPPDDIGRYIFARVVKIIAPLLERNPKSIETPTKEENQLRDIMNLNLEKLDKFPWGVREFKSFERKNPDIGISIYGLESQSSTPSETCINKKKTSKDFKVIVKYHNMISYGRKNQINLLHLATDNTEHYCLIKDFDGFLNGTSNTKSFICPRCLHRHGSKEALEHHMIKCGKDDICQIVMPDEDKKILRFTKHVFKSPLPFVHYGDTEAHNVYFDKATQVDGFNCIDDITTCIIQSVICVSDVGFEICSTKKSKQCKTKQIARQDTSAFGLKCVSRYQEHVKNDYFSYRGTNHNDTMEKVAKELIRLEYLYGSRKYNSEQLKNIKTIKFHALEECRKYDIIEANMINHKVAQAGKFGKCYLVRLERYNEKVSELFETFLPKGYNEMSRRKLMCSTIIKDDNGSVKIQRKKGQDYYRGLLRTNIPFDGVIPEDQKKQVGDECECFYCHRKLIRVAHEEKKKKDVSSNKALLDHDHYTGKFRGWACYDCNTAEGRATKFVPIFFHNLSGYDGHPLILELAKYTIPDVRELKPIAKTKENYIGFQFGCLRFIDSLRFFQKSLEGVAESMVDADFIEQMKSLEEYASSLSDDDLINLKSIIPKDYISIKEALKLIRKKGIYPYDWVDSFARYDEKHPPPIKSFYSKVREEGITTSDYEHVKLVWKVFKCKNFGDYTDLYMKTDVMLLADAFEKFRKFFLINHEIDPCHTYSAPSLTWQCGLKYCGKVWDGCYDIIHKLPIEDLEDIKTKFEELSNDTNSPVCASYIQKLASCFNVPTKSIIKLKSIITEDLLEIKSNPEKYKFGLELLIDKDMLVMMEGGIRGGYSGLLGDRLVKANNKYLPDYQQDLLSNFLLYLDANNLYGWAMSQLLPYSEFMWIKHDYVNDKGEHLEIDKHKLLADKNFMKNRGLILELDLEYTDEAKRKTYKFPLAVENKKIDKNDLSPLQQQQQERDKIPLGNKLICDLKDKEHYIVYLDNLNFYLQQGMRIKKIHRILSFRKEAWLEPYIDFNTQQRTKSKTEFEKDIWKLMNNAFYGKTMENIRKRVDVRLETSGPKIQKLHSKLNYQSETIFTEELTAVQMRKEKLYFNKPIYIGMVVLELSKLLMYKTFYNVILKRWPSAEIIGFDTDSFFLNIFTEDIYKDMEAILDTLDTSEYPTNHPLFTNHPSRDKNKKVIGKFKDELFGEIMTILRFSRSKQYEFEIYPSERAKRLKKEGKFGFKLSEDYEAIKLKGAPKVAIKTGQVKGSDFHEVITNPNSDPKYISANLIRNKLHENYIIEINKKALSSYDDKRWIADDGIHTRPFGWESIADVFKNNPESQLAHKQVDVLGR